MRHSQPWRAWHALLLSIFIAVNYSYFEALELVLTSDEHHLLISGCLSKSALVHMLTGPVWECYTDMLCKNQGSFCLFLSPTLMFSRRSMCHS